MIPDHTPDDDLENIFYLDYATQFEQRQAIVALQNDLHNERIETAYLRAERGRLFFDGILAGILAVLLAHYVLIPTLARLPWPL